MPVLLHSAKGYSPCPLLPGALTPFLPPFPASSVAQRPGSAFLYLPGDPCPQPGQLSTEGLPACVPLVIRDYFKDSGFGFGLIIGILCCFPLGEKTGVEVQAREEGLLVRKPCQVLSLWAGPVRGWSMSRV